MGLFMHQQPSQLNIDDAVGNLHLFQAIMHHVGLCNCIHR